MNDLTRRRSLAANGKRRSKRKMEIILQGVHRFPELVGLPLEKWIQRVAGELAPREQSFGVRFVGRSGMSAYCERFYPSKKVTDVLSFPGEASEEGKHLGDVVICVPLAREQAVRANHSIEKEVKILLLHGILHCLGFDHERDSGQMETLEQRLRRRWIERGKR